MRNYSFKPYSVVLNILSIFIILLAIFNILIAPDNLSADYKIKTIAVFPFDVISKEDSSFIGKGMGKMLCSRIGSDNAIRVKCMERLPSDYGIDVSGGAASLIGNSSATSELNGVDYILVGTITIAGDNISSDARLIELLSPEAMKYINATGKGMGDIMQHATAITEKVRVAILGENLNSKKDITVLAKNPFSSSIGSNTTQNSGAVNKNPAVLNNQLTSSSFSNKHTVKSAVNENVLKEDIDLSLTDSSILLNRKFDTEIRGIATADIDGDERLDLVLLDEHTISFFVFENNNIVKKGGFESKYYSSNLSIDAIDSNSNGRAELYITAIGKNNRIKSYVLEWNGREFETTLKDADWYFRVVNIDGYSRLIGQQRQFDEVFGEAIYSLDAKNGKIFKQEKILADNSNDINNGSGLFGFSFLNTNGNNFDDKGDANNTRGYLVWYDRSGYLNLGDERGGREWKSSQSFGSTPLFIEQDKGKDNLKERFYINSRVVIADIDKNNTQEIITISNSDVAKGYLSGYRKFNQGNILIMEWKNGLMVERWKSRPVTNYISDVNVIDLDGDSYPEIIYSAINDSGIIMNKSHSTVFIEKIIDQSK